MRGGEMPYTAKANKFFRAVEHGFKPDRFKTSLTPEKAGQLADEGVKGERHEKMKKEVHKRFKKHMGY